MEKYSTIQDSKGNFLSKDEVSRNFIDKLISNLYISAKGNDIVEVAVIPYLKNKLQLVLPAGEFQNKKKISEISKKSQQTIEKVVNGQIVYEKSNSNSWFEFGLSGADYIISGFQKAENLLKTIQNKANLNIYAIVINIIGNSVSGRKDEYKLIRASEDIREITFNNGSRTSIFNIYLSDSSSVEYFPNDVNNLKSRDFSEVIFEMSSQPHQIILDNLHKINKNINFTDSKAMVINDNLDKVINLFSFEV
jgi:hypothetical protein